MKIFYLPGNNPSNRTWIEEVKKRFDKFSSGEILYYQHWQTGEKWANLQTESTNLLKLIGDEKDYFIFAKSIGTVLALKNVFEKTITPDKIVFCGHPYEVAVSNGSPIDQYLKALIIPTIFIQNEFDPAFSFASLKKTLEKNNPLNYQLIKIPNNSTHDYSDMENLEKIVTGFFK